MKEEKSEKKSKISFGGAVKIAAIPTIVATFGLVFVTKDSFSAWKDTEYYPYKESARGESAIQSERISKIETREKFYEAALTRIEKNQLLILQRLK